MLKPIFARTPNIFRIKLRGAFLILIVFTNIEICYAGSPKNESIIRGKYIFDSAGCAGCHTDIENKGPLIAGGRALKTRFGVFYGPNITPDRIFGIGKWSDKEFVDALRHGISPNGQHYFPVFPYTSFTKMRDRDIIDLKEYIFSLEPIAKPNIPHKVSFPFGIRKSIFLWKLLYFRAERLQIIPNRGRLWNRGAYLTNAIFHCGECHTPRNLLGSPVAINYLAGTTDGPTGGPVPNITQDNETGIGKWTKNQLLDFFKIGMLPDGDFVGDTMAEIIENTGRLKSEDLKAIIKYLQTIPGIKNTISKQD